MKASNTDRAPPSQKAKVLSIGLTKPNPPKTEEHGKAITAPASKSQREQKTEDVGDDKKASVPSTRRSSPSRGDKENSTRTADAVVREQAADVDEATLKELYGKGHLNVAFIGHVDAGKSTLGGAILVSVGMVDQRTLDKYKKDAKDMGRETVSLEDFVCHEDFYSRSDFRWFLCILALGSKVSGIFGLAHHTVPTTAIKTNQDRQVC